jgi:hypothetical protein
MGSDSLELDQSPKLTDNTFMSSTTESLADLEAVLLGIAEKSPLDPEVEKRVYERAEKVREQLSETNIAVDLIREAREE